MKICAPFAGIVRYHVAVGDTVAPGEVVATIETTKLESPVACPGPGTVESLARPDFSDVLGGDELAVIAPAAGESAAQDPAVDESAAQDPAAAEPSLRGEAR